MGLRAGTVLSELHNLCDATMMRRARKGEEVKHSTFQAMIDGFLHRLYVIPLSDDDLAEPPPVGNYVGVDEAANRIF